MGNTSDADPRPRSVFNAFFRGLGSWLLAATVGLVTLKLESNLVPFLWTVAWVIVPLWAACSVHRWRLDLLKLPRALSRPWFLWAGAAIVLLLVLCGSSLLVFEPPQAALDEVPSRNWMRLGRVGDLRYKLIAATEPSQRITIVLMDPVENPEVDLVTRRSHLKDLIEIAQRQGATGVAFDFWFERESSSDKQSAGVIIG